MDARSSEVWHRVPAGAGAADDPAVPVPVPADDAGVDPADGPAVSPPLPDPVAAAVAV